MTPADEFNQIMTMQINDIQQQLRATGKILSKYDMWKHYLYEISPHSELITELIIGYHNTLKSSISKHVMNHSSLILNLQHITEHFLFDIKEKEGLEKIQAIWTSVDQWIESSSYLFLDWCFSQQQLNNDQMEMRWQYSYRKMIKAIDDVIFMHKSLLEIYVPAACSLLYDP